MLLDLYRSSRPMIRLHNFDRSELECLRAGLASLSNTERTQLPLHEEPYVAPLAGCHFTLRVGLRDFGIQHSIEPNLFGWISEPGAWDPYVCELTPPTWGNVVRGVDLLLQLRFLCSEYVWLNRQWDPPGTVAWLLSATGEW